MKKYKKNVQETSRMNKEIWISVKAVLGGLLFISALSITIYFQSGHLSPVLVSIAIGFVAGLVFMQKTDLAYFKSINIKENQKAYADMFSKKKIPVPKDSPMAEYYTIVFAVVAALVIFLKYDYVQKMWLVLLLAVCLAIFTAFITIGFKRLYYALTGKLKS